MNDLLGFRLSNPREFSAKAFGTKILELPFKKSQKPPSGKQIVKQRAAAT